MPKRTSLAVVVNQEVAISPVLTPNEARVEGMRRQALELSRRHENLVVVDQRTYDLAVQDRATLKTYIENIDALFESSRVKAYEAYKEILAQRDSLKEMVVDALQRRNSSIATWHEQQRQLQQEKEDRLLEQARKKAEKIRQKQIKRAEVSGYDSESIEAMKSAPLDVAPVQAEPTFEAGVGTRTNWKAEVTNKFELIKFVAKNKHFIHLLEPNASALNTLAKDQKSDLSIPGVRAFPKTGVADKRK